MRKLSLQNKSHNNKKAQNGTKIQSKKNLKHKLQSMEKDMQMQAMLMQDVPKHLIKKIQKLNVKEQKQQKNDKVFVNSLCMFNKWLKSDKISKIITDYNDKEIQIQKTEENLAENNQDN